VFLAGNLIGYRFSADRSGKTPQRTRFLDDPRIPVDNNRSEGALRVVALGRKNFLFAGNEVAGKNLAGIYSLISTCEACGVNPMEYLPDVLRRISSHPAADIDALLPEQWQSLS
jgi:transposase